MPFTLPENLPPLPLLLVWDNLAGHKTPAMVLWLCQHGIMPLYTPLGGSWLNLAEAIQRILKRRALDGQHPHSPAEIGVWFEQTAQAWNLQPTPFVWNGKRCVEWQASTAAPSIQSPLIHRRCRSAYPAIFPALQYKSQEYRNSCQMTH